MRNVKLPAEQWRIGLRIEWLGWYQPCFNKKSLKKLYLILNFNLNCYKILKFDDIFFEKKIENLQNS